MNQRIWALPYFLLLFTFQLEKPVKMVYAQPPGPHASIDFDLPDGSRVIPIRGRPFTGADQLDGNTWTIAKPASWIPYPIRITLPDGSKEQRQLFLKPGMAVRIALPSTDIGSSRVVLQSGHAAKITTMQISTGGKRMLTASSDHTSILWRLSDQRQLHSFTGHGEGVSSVAFAPKAMRAITGGMDGKAVVWDLIRNKTIGDPLGHSNHVHYVAFNKNASLALTVAGGDPHRGGEGAAILWDVKKAERLQHFKDGLYGIFWADLSPDETKVVGASYQRTLLWDVKSEHPLRTWPKCRFVHFGSTGSLLVTDAGLLMIDEDMLTVAFKYDGKPTACALTVDRTHYALGTSNGHVHIWTLPKGNKIRVIKQEGAIDALAFSPDGEFLSVASGGSDERPSQVRQWTWKEERGSSSHLFDERSRHGKPDPVEFADFHKDGIRLVSRHGDRMTLWTHGVSSARTAISPVTGTPTGEAFDSSDKVMAVGVYHDNPRGYVYSWAPRVTDRVQLLHDPLGRVQSVASSGRSIACASDRSVTWIDRISRSIRDKLAVSASQLIDVDCTDERLLTVFVDGYGLLKAITKGDVEASVTTTIDGTISSVACSAAEQICCAAVVSVRDDKTVMSHLRCWDSVSGEQLWKTNEEEGYCTYIAFDNRAERVVMGFANATLVCRAAKDGRELLSVQTPGQIKFGSEEFAFEEVDDQRDVTAAAFDPTGNRLFLSNSRHPLPF